MLCDCSGYFKRLCVQRASEENTDEPIVLVDTDPCLFGEVLARMYHEEMACPYDNYPLLRQFLIDLWVLAKKLEIPILQNRAILILNKKVESSDSKLISRDGVHPVYLKTPRDSLLRYYGTDTWARAFVEQVFKRDVPEDFLINNV